MMLPTGARRDTPSCTRHRAYPNQRTCLRRMTRSQVSASPRIKIDAACDTVLRVLLDNATLDPREMWESSRSKPGRILLLGTLSRESRLEPLDWC